MATAQVVSATTALMHDEKIEDQLNKKPEDDIKNTVEDQETAITAPQQEAADDNAVAPPEPELVEPEALAVEVETKVVLEEEDKANRVDQPEKVAPEPEPEATETKEHEVKPVETKNEPEPEPAEVAKVDTEPEEKIEKKEEAVAADQE